MMTTIDRDAPGYPGDAYGLSDEEAKELRWPAAPLKEILWPWGAVTFAFGAAFMLLIWPHINAYLSPVLPETEWAYDSTGIRELQDSGLDGSGVHVCMVDTGLDSMHPDLANISLVGFRDFYEGQHGIIRDVGEEWHGTMMAGLLVADGKFRGAAPGVDLSIALALGPSGTSGQEDFVAQAVNLRSRFIIISIATLCLVGYPLIESNRSYLPTLLSLAMAVSIIFYIFISYKESHVVDSEETIGAKNRSLFYSLFWLAVSITLMWMGTTVISVHGANAITLLGLSLIHI